MIVYRDGHRDENPRALLRRLRTMAHAVAADGLVHERVRDLLIEFGILESGVADALNPERDAPAPLTDAMRDVSHQLGRVFVASSSGTPRAQLRHLAGVALDAITELAGRTLPDSITVSHPEGYAYYGVFPEQYAAAASRLASQLAPGRAVCIGVRSIGTSLSAVVAAELERIGCSVHSYTVRPRGHPFARTVALEPHLEQRIIADRAAMFIVVDEGPGLSGSSFASVATALTRVGIPEEHIVFLPSWLPDGSGFVSEAAREVWPRHRKFHVSFDECWLDSGRLAAALGASGSLTDVSAGAWRTYTIPRVDDWPAVQPQHERRKYLAPRDDRAALYRFTGLGDAGVAQCERAAVLADAGFSLPPLASTHGFTATEWVDARPLTPADVDAPLLDRIARYIAFLAREFPARTATRPAQLHEMVEVNARELLGDAAGGAASDAVRASGAFEDAHAVALDGRMAPHEWLLHAGTTIKTDATEHHDDHFFPGSQDPAWDLAATVIEFCLTDAARRYLLARFIRCGGDAATPARMPAYELAYLAFRGGYATTALSALEPGAERGRWQRALDRYRHQLRRRLVSQCNAA